MDETFYYSYGYANKFVFRIYATNPRGNVDRGHWDYGNNQRKQKRIIQELSQRTCSNLVNSTYISRYIRMAYFEYTNFIRYARLFFISQRTNIIYNPIVCYHISSHDTIELLHLISLLFLVIEEISQVSEVMSLTIASCTHFGIGVTHMQDWRPEVYQNAVPIIVWFWKACHRNKTLSLRK